MKSYTLLLFGLICIATHIAQSQNTSTQNPSMSLLHDHSMSGNHDRIIKSKNPAGIRFIKNKGQWPAQVEYKTSIEGSNSLYLEKEGFTYVFTHKGDLEKMHDVSSGLSQESIRSHAYQVHFKNANQPSFQEGGRQKTYHNYFLGNDPEQWASKVPLYDKVTYENLYDGIDLEAYSNNSRFKYDFIVAPNADPTQIRLDYLRVDALELDNSHLVIHTSVELVLELAPYAYQIINGKERQVSCEYELEGNSVYFIFPEGYDADQTLIIDPTVVASTLSGNIGEGSFGHTATYDQDGNIFAAGRCFGQGYPTTLGAFQSDYAGGEVDIALTKYTADGSEQIFATYIGGSGNDYPHSMVSNFNGQLYILGTTSSNDFPISNSAYQSEFGGFIDIMITKLNAEGTALVGSTYIGGSYTDGENNSTLNSNYDDRFRGEINLDNQGNVYVASCTTSDDFPTSADAFDTTLETTGTNSLLQDGVVFKLNSDLSALIFSTFLGSEDPDAAFGVRVDDFGKVYVTGFAGNDDFPTTPGVVQENWVGGTEKAFVSILNATGSALIASTFWGTNGDEHSFFLDLDNANNIHIYGQTTGVMETTPGVYSYGQGSRQFISAFSNDLSTVLYNTTIGSDNSTTYDFTPSAFAVDKCDNIHFSGYCFEAESELPVTDDAFSTTPGTMYFGLLDSMARSLAFASFFGNANHTDGGTSRFDKSGRLYQAVCSCNTSGILETMDQAYAQTQTTFCDVGVFKVDFEIETVTAVAMAAPTTTSCAPFTVEFNYTGQAATSLEWDFGDDSSASNQTNISHTYSFPGAYQVRLIATNEATCNVTDTSYLMINVLDGTAELNVNVNINPPTEGNSDGSAEFNIMGGIPPYSILFEDSLYTETLSIDNLGLGSYTYQIIDGSSCIYESSFDIDFVLSSHLPDDEKSINIYPSPFTDLINIEVQGKMPHRLKVVDQLGRILQERNISPIDNYLELSMEQIPNGTYWIIFNYDKKVIAKPLVKMKY